ncbi:hypothetical protein AB0I37_07455 [Micromonospora purpureochromogenes]|uniref:hypothetical protein n=1 Tax=Micromonospora purpureochromogenes TaxID=47872 RepID=UPI0033D3C3EC
MSENLSSGLEATALVAPLKADSVASPRLVYGGLEINAMDGADLPYPALYFDVAESHDLGRVTFEGLDAVRGSRGEYLPYEVNRYEPDDWVYVLNGSSWLRGRHEYELRHYSTPLLDTNRHYMFVFHDEFVEAIAEGIWFDIADRDNPFAPPTAHPLAALTFDAPAERFTSVDGLIWELRRSPRTDSDLIHGSQYCSQRLFQFNLVLDGISAESASIWIRTINGKVMSRFSHCWSGDLADGPLEGFAQPNEFTVQWQTYLSGVADRRRRAGKH